MKISISAALDCSIDSAWEALHTPAVFRRVSSPFTVFRTAANQPLPLRFQPGQEYVVSVWAGGVIPLGKQTISLTDDHHDWRERTVTDSGHGQSGALGLLQNWNHRMSVSARPDGRTDFRDTLSVRAGVFTPVLWLGLRVMWLWRGLRLKQIARVLDPASTATWNARYIGASSMWSGKVNPVLSQVADSLTPGRAIDAGAGEGGDALWLAQKGWQVTALEASSVGIYRGVTEHDRQSTPDQPLNIHWRVWDLAEAWPVEPGSADLVSLQFIHTDPATRSAIWSEAVKAVAPGGTLLIVGHDPADAEAGIPRPPAPMCFSQSDARAAIPEEWSSVNTRVVSRQQRFGEREVTVGDIVLEAVR